VSRRSDNIIDGAEAAGMRADGQVDALVDNMRISGISGE